MRRWLAVIAASVALLGCSPVEQHSAGTGRDHVSGAVVGVLSDHVFVLSLTGPPAQELLVLSVAVAVVHTSDIVSVAGQRVRFHYAEFGDPFWLTDQRAVKRFENGPAVLATEVRALAG